MGLWSSFREALGLNARPAVRALPPLALTRNALDRLAALPPGHGLRLRRHATPSGHVISVDEAEVAGPFYEALDELPIDLDPSLLEALRGVVLHREDGRWRLSLDLVLRAKETPNPHGRLYEADRPLADGRRFFPTSSAQDPDLPDLARLLLMRPDVHSAMLRGPTLTVERHPDAPWDPIDRAVGEAVRAHLLGGGGLVDASVASTDGDALTQRVARVLDEDVRPALHADGGDLDLIDVRDGVVTVHLIGACRTCPASALTLHAAVESKLRQALPGEIAKVVPYTG